jgi:hypothetical protein
MKDETFRLIIAGSRNFYDKKLLGETACQFLLEEGFRPIDDVVILSGKSKGADTLGEDLAKYFGWSVKEFPADWSLGIWAGMARNKTMARNADGLVAFCIDHSPGTTNMIEEAIKMKLPVWAVQITTQPDHSYTIKLEKHYPQPELL